MSHIANHRDGDWYIHAIGVAAPENIVTQDEVVAALSQVYSSERTMKLLRRLAKVSCVNTRCLAGFASRPGAEEAPLYRPASEQPHGPTMGARNMRFEATAAPLVKSVLEQLPQNALPQVEALVTVSCTHASSPGLERPIFDHAPLPLTVDRWNLGFMGCSAALSGLRLIEGLTPRGRDGAGAALLVACELSSLHFQYSEALDQMTANMLFADGAAGVLLSPQPGSLRVVGARSIALPEFAEQMVWMGDDYGLRLELSQELPRTLAAHLRQGVGAFLDDHGVRLSDVAHWLVHPGGPQIVDAVENVLELPDNAAVLSRDVLREYGNMSSATILFILKRLMAQGANGKCVLMAFGPGLTIELVLLEAA